MQPVAWALRAFNVEVALVRDMVSERETGMGRIAFWRELLDSIYKVMHTRGPVKPEIEGKK